MPEACIQSHHRRLCHLDASWPLEHEIIKALTGERLNAHVFLEVEGMMPSESHETRVQDVLTKLEVLMSSAVYKMSAEPVQGQVRAAKSMLVSLSQGFGPSVTACEGGNTTEFIGKLLRMVPFFCRYRSGAAASSSGGGRLHGAAAAAAMFEDAKKKEKTPMLLEELHLFAFLLKDAQKAELREWSSATVASKKRKPAQEATSSKKQKRVTKAAESAWSEAASMFR